MHLALPALGTRYVFDIACFGIMHLALPVLGMCFALPVQNIYAFSIASIGYVFGTASIEYLCIQHCQYRISMHLKLAVLGMYSALPVQNIYAFSIISIVYVFGIASIEYLCFQNCQYWVCILHWISMHLELAVFGMYQAVPVLDILCCCYKSKFLLYKSSTSVK